MRKHLLPFLLFPVLALAQPTVAPTDGVTVGPAEGGTYAKYNVTQSWEAGYRFASLGGNEGKYRSDVNFGNGIRLFSSSMAVRSLDGHGNLFDEIVLSTAGLGNDPYEAVTLRVQKNRLYRYDAMWRLNDYYNPGLTVASGTHLQDTTHRWQDHDLTFFPQSAFRVRAGYGRVTRNGPTLTTQQFFDTRGDALPIFANLRQQYDEYRLGFDAKLKGFRLTILRRWEFFKEDTAGNVTTPETGPSPTVLTGYATAQPIRGQTPSWMGNLIGEFNWLVLNARATYAGGEGNFTQNEIATGTDHFGAAQNRQVVVNGNGDRPVLTGDLNTTIFPKSRFAILNNLSVANTRMVGTNAFIQYDFGTLSTERVNFQFLGVRLLTDVSDARFRISKKFDVFGGFRYSDRLVRSNETGAPAGSVIPNFPIERSDRTKAGIAGFNLLPIQGLRLHMEAELGRNDNPFVPVSLANYHALRGRAIYRLKNVSLGGGYQENYNNNSITVTSYSSKARNYSADGSWITKSGISFDTSYSKLHLDTIGGIAFFAGEPRPTLTTGQSIYVSNLHAFNIGVRLPATKHAELYIGYSLTKDTGDGRSSLATQPTASGQLLYNVQTFPLTYQTPMVRLSVRLNEKLRWNAGYQYYGYNEVFGVFSQNQDYRANTGYTSLLWAF
jgi:hypothetical protein